MSIDNPSIVECEEDIHWIYENEGHLQPTITCGYCGAKARKRDVFAAIRWFHDHETIKKADPGYDFG